MGSGPSQTQCGNAEVDWANFRVSIHSGVTWSISSIYKSLGSLGPLKTLRYAKSTPELLPLIRSLWAVYRLVLVTSCFCSN